MIRNVPSEKPVLLKNIINIRENQIISKVLTDSEHIHMTVLAFAENEDVSEEKYPGDTIYYSICGTALITNEDGNVHTLHEGEILLVKKGCLHAVKGQGGIKILQIIVEE